VRELRLCSALILLLLVLLPSSGQAAEDVEEFIDDIGEALYAFAWPTATYKGIRLDDISSNPNGGADLTLVVYGLSGFDGSSLWTQVIITVRNWEITDLRWGRHNAIISPPGETVKAFGQMLEELNRESQRTARVTQTWILSDSCADGGGAHFRLFEMAGDRASLIWPNLNDTYWLPRGESRSVQVQVNRGAKLCYGAASEDGQRYWGVGISGDKGCQDCCRIADGSSFTYTLNCG
jgi:hypothetical protein